MQWAGRRSCKASPSTSGLWGTFLAGDGIHLPWPLREWHLSWPPINQQQLWAWLGLPGCPWAPLQVHRSRVQLSSTPSCQWLFEQWKKKLKMASWSSYNMPGTVLRILCALFSFSYHHNLFMGKLRLWKAVWEPEVTLLGSGGSGIQIQIMWLQGLHAPCSTALGWAGEPLYQKRLRPRRRQEGDGGGEGLQ